MVTVTLQGSPSEVHEEARAFFGLGLAPAVVEVVPKELVEVKKAKVSEPKVIEAKVSEPKAIEAKSAPVEEAIPEKNESDADLFAKIQAIIPKVMAHIKRDGMVKLMAKYGTQSAKTMDPKHYRAFLTEAESLLPK